MSEPQPDPATLTPAQVELIDAKIEDRADRVLATMHAAIADAIANLISYGGRIALRTASGAVLLCVTDGGPTEDHEPITIESRTGTGGPWETFIVERGQP